MTYGVQDVCDRYGVGEHTVLGWIRRGELKAIDVSRKRGGRPKWRITEDALAMFELARSNTAPPAPSPRQKRSPGVIEFYK